MEFDRIIEFLAGEECENCIDYFQWDNAISYSLEEELIKSMWGKMRYGVRDPEKELRSKLMNYQVKVSRFFDWIKMITIPSGTTSTKQTYSCPQHLGLNGAKHYRTLFMFFSDAIAHFNTSSVDVSKGSVLICKNKKMQISAPKGSAVYVICIYTIVD